MWVLSELLSYPVTLKVCSLKCARTGDLITDLTATRRAPWGCQNTVTVQRAPISIQFEATRLLYWI
jgi:hypothetical protein